MIKSDPHLFSNPVSKKNVHPPRCPTSSLNPPPKEKCRPPTSFWTIRTLPRGEMSGGEMSGRKCSGGKCPDTRIAVRERGTSNSACAEERNSNSGATLFPEIGWCQTFHATPNQRSDAVDNALRVGEPVKDILHIRRDLAKLRNAAHKTGCRSQDPV